MRGRVVQTRPLRLAAYQSRNRETQTPQFRTIGSASTERHRMVAEVYAGLSAIKTAFDMAKGLKDIHDATLRNAAVIELQEKILSAQSEQATLVVRVRELEQEVDNLKSWNADKDRYQLER